MTAKLIVLALAAIALAACETATHDVSLSSETAAPTSNSVRVVRGAVVPDDPVAPVVKRRVKHVAAGVAATPKTNLVAPVEAVPAPIETAAVVPPTPAIKDPVVAAPGEMLPIPTPTPAVPDASAVVADAPPAVTAPAVETVTPTSPAADAQPVTPGWRMSDVPVLLQAMVGGVPIWMMALIGVVLLAALGLGMSGGRKAEAPESRHEPEPA